MGMRIRTNVASNIAQRNMERNNADMSQSLERLSSGYRINKSADDAAGLAITENLRGTVRGLNVAKRNANDAVSLVQVAEGSMNEMSNILIRMRELTVQSASDTLGEQERSYLNREYTQLVDEIDRIGNALQRALQSPNVVQRFSRVLRSRGNSTTRSRRRFSRPTPSRRSKTCISHSSPSGAPGR